MKRNLDPLQEETFDLVVLGGGITGAGIALDAVLRGLRVALIDKGDFASGTSSVSSKLIHGGLRYLEQGQFRLVREALQERRLLLHNAPHLVRPLRFLIPFYWGTRLSPWQWRLSLTLYDFLAGQHNLGRSRPITAAQLRQAFPSLVSSNLAGGAYYCDAQMDDARLCLTVIRTAALQGARVANYVQAVGFEWVAGRLAAVRAVDRLTERELVIQARQVVNATGPWSDAVCRLAGDQTGPHLSPTRGVHLIAPNRVGLTVAFLLLHPTDGRVFFALPWFMTDPTAAPDKVLVGTTDTMDEDDPDRLRITDQDLDYLIEGFNHYFRPTLVKAEILGSFVGLRPLIRSRSGQPSSFSREFQVVEAPSGLLSVIGGKYTTYRRMAEVVTDEVVRRLGGRRSGRTRHFRLDGAPPGPWQAFFPQAVQSLEQQYGLPAPTARHLVGRYGQRAPDVAIYLRLSGEMAQPLIAGEPDLRAEWAYQRDHEMAIFPADHWLRRMRLGWYRVPPAE